MLQKLKKSEKLTILNLILSAEKERILDIIINSIDYSKRIIFRSLHMGQSFNTSNQRF